MKQEDNDHDQQKWYFSNLIMANLADSCIWLIIIWNTMKGPYYLLGMVISMIQPMISLSTWSCFSQSVALKIVLQQAWIYINMHVPMQSMQIPFWITFWLNINPRHTLTLPFWLWCLLLTVIMLSVYDHWDHFDVQGQANAWNYCFAISQECSRSMAARRQQPEEWLCSSQSLIKICLN